MPPHLSQGIKLNSREGKLDENHGIQDFFQKPGVGSDFCPVDIQRKQKLPVPFGFGDPGPVVVADILKLPEHAVGAVSHGHIEPIRNPADRDDPVHRHG